MKAKFIIALAAVVVFAVVVCVVSRQGEPSAAGEGGPSTKEAAGPRRKGPRPATGGAEAVRPSAVKQTEASAPASDGAEVDDGEENSQSEEDKAQDEEEAKVEAFDALTDKWMEPAKTPVTIKDIDAFAEKFRSLPKERRDECLHRALNLIPDANVMLLAGILMDKSQDKDTVELIFNDVLNRDENVKMPILKQIFKDKEHPCWADTAWILDVTGEVQNKSN